MSSFDVLKWQFLHHSIPCDRFSAGIVQGTAKVVRAHSHSDFRQLTMQFPPAAVHNVQIGASVALNGPMPGIPVEAKQ